MTIGRFRVIEERPYNLFPDYEYVGWGECSSPSPKDKFTSVGSCLAVSLYDNEDKRGVLAHLTGIDEWDNGFNASTVVDFMVKRLTTNTHASSKLEASLSGGVFHEELILVDIGAVVSRLQVLDIPIIGHDIGPGYRRAILLKGNGNVEVYRHKVPQ